MDKKKLHRHELPGVYKVGVRDSRPAYDNLCSIYDSVRFVGPDGHWIEVRYDSQTGMFMIRAVNCLTVHPNSSNVVGLSQSPHYAVLDVRLDDRGAEEDVECPEGEARFFTADGQLHEDRYTPDSHE